MHSTRKQFAILISLIILLIVSFSQSVCANEEFTPINTNEISQISNKRLFFVTSKHGFVHSSKTGSPLNDEIPAEISGPKHEIESVNTVIVQAIKTSAQDFQRLEGGLPGGKWVWIIIGGILGGIIATFFRQQPLLGAVIGATALLVLVASIYEADDFTMYVDNATDQHILFAVDSLSPISIPAHSQMGVKFKEGLKSIKILKATDKSELEHFDLQATNYRNNSGSEYSGYYIYNVAAINSYTISHAAYKQK